MSKEEEVVELMVIRRDRITFAIIVVIGMLVEALVSSWSLVVVVIFWW